MAPSPRLRTAHYTQGARDRLAEAFVAARKALGFDKPEAFAKFAGISPRAYWALENAEPTVGQLVLEKGARAVPGWTLDTVRSILERPSDALPVVTRSNGDQTVQTEDPVDYQAVLDIAEGLPRDTVIRIVVNGVRRLPEIRARRGDEVHNKTFLTLLRLAEKTGQTLDELLRNSAS